MNRPPFAMLFLFTMEVEFYETMSQLFAACQKASKENLKYQVFAYADQSGTYFKLANTLL